MMNKQTAGPQRWENQLECEALRSAGPMEPGSVPHIEPLILSTVWQLDSPMAADQALSGANDAFAYRRDGHPNERSLAHKLASLHGASQASITAQGMSAISAVAMGILEPGGQVWLGQELYGKTSRLFEHSLAKWQITTRHFDPTDKVQIDELSRQKVDLVLVETLSNPRLSVARLEDISVATHAAGGKLVVDNTFATHLVCQPLSYGADFVVESLSKQVNGHSDSMLGLVAGNDRQLMDCIQDTISTFGMASSPLDCYLTHRGLMSLALRLERACVNALALAEALDALPTTIEVDYPGLTHHPQHQFAKEQLRGGYGWMLTFHLPLQRPEVADLFRKLAPEIPFAPSLGDICTTLSHPATTSHRGYSESQRVSLGITEGTIRVSCGVEPAEWLIEQFSQAILDFARA
ncbi:trans-sulfuration enzyme family protein [Aureliella helgolandensis]|uniref:Cystathionine beta-lyase n=1 Tax=Aureliella helgolandensis TaxID=2527968 RepID=A0A518G7Y9_9BACT|nr:aminotransferase class I/II-fold pyridoxal phosphate-dependent enzyme [Aureliella helgolandensis]QDV24699.1 Cystathionine beta-lyase [Aureliella helgolandensis]